MGGAHTATIAALHEEAQRLRATVRQYRAAYSHQRQLTDHYVAALSALMREVTCPEYGTAIEAARDALRKPPEWDGVLRA
jgi:hypothetical protein